ASIQTTVPDIINWPVQKRKMWQGKGNLPPWIEVRRIAGKAIDNGLQTHTLEELVDIVKQPCKEAGIKAARNKRDKDAQLKREYHNMVMSLLHGRSRSKVVPPRTVDIAELTGRIESLQAEAARQKKKKDQGYVEVEAPDRSAREIPQHTGFYASLFKGFFNPPTLQMPSPGSKRGLFRMATNGGADRLPKAGKEPDDMPVEETHYDDLNEWVNVEKDLDSEWEPVAAKR
ncbi:hypothetical protein C8A01DRAFT_18553, partial [Parachaetomium inaequale]